MATVENAQFERYFEIFPELTPKQTITCIMHAMGLAIPMIADLRGVSDETVRKMLQESRKELELSNLCALRAVVQIRLSMAVMGLNFDLLDDRLHSAHRRNARHEQPGQKGT
ncbi:hypothetical protein [Erwinia amylovora]|uniref:hypothetical protein n=1 Tax=Erwinia amylovora TaxID=552 RepID=UPI001443D4AA|nr:hypothetical protein [Erwinia amylovora]